MSNERRPFKDAVWPWLLLLAVLTLGAAGASGLFRFREWIPGAGTDVVFGGTNATTGEGRWKTMSGALPEVVHHTSSTIVVSNTVLSILDSILSVGNASTISSVTLVTTGEDMAFNSAGIAPSSGGSTLTVGTQGNPFSNVWSGAIYTKAGTSTDFLRAGGALFSMTNTTWITNTTAVTGIISNNTGILTLQAGFLTPGTVIKCEFAGEITTPASPGGMTNRVTLGGNILATNTVPFVASLVNDPFSVSFTITCRSIGAAGSVICEGEAFLPTSAGGVQSRRRLRLASGPVTVDTTGALALSLDIHPGTTTTGLKIFSGFGWVQMP